MIRRRPALALALAAAPGLAQVAPPPPSDPLVEGFLHPPADARPLVYWQWVNGNVSEDGIRRDFAWMHRVGLGGAFLFDVGFNSPPVPQYVERRVGFGTPEWASAVRVAAVEAKRWGLSFGAQSSGGWSVSGDPGVPPAQAMKKLVWSETDVAGGGATVRLPPLPRVSGPYQDLPIAERFREPMLGGDVAVIAYRLPPDEALPRPTIDLPGEGGRLSDGRYDAAVPLAPDAGGTAAIGFRFDRAVRPGALRLSVDGMMPAGRIEADGQVRAVLAPAAPQAAPVRTIVLAGRAARRWRVVFTGVKAPIGVREARFLAGPQIDRVEDKAGFGATRADEALRTRPAAGVPIRSVLDLTAKLSPDGRLAWTPPVGRWRIVRFGWSLTGRRSVPAPPESTGLEVDKLDPDAVRAYAARFYDRYRAAAGPGGRFDLALTDSWEAGQQSWTPAMRAAFCARRGYDPLPWLPVLTGRVIGDTDRSERFLADWRRTIADLLADNHYGVFAAVLRARGLRYYAEAPGTDLPTVADGLQARNRVDVPMGEYWYWPEGGGPKPAHVADIREAASAAHLAGKPLIAAEALTSMGEEPWATGPAQWRHAVDRFFAEGVNRVVMHTTAHQPWPDRRPGITLRQYGQHFTRNEAWADLADGWVGYLSRTSFLLQQGRPVADVAVFAGEDAPVAPIIERPAGYDIDLIDAETLLARTSVEDGRLTTSGGARYRVLAIDPGVTRMSVPMLRRLQSLVQAGAVLAGPSPRGRLGLGDDAATFARLRAALWGRGGPRRIGRGLILPAMSAAEALARLGVGPDLSAGPLDWTHRRLADGDIYFLSNPSAGPFAGTVAVRDEAMSPTTRAELWDAADGSRRAAPGRGRRFALALAPHASAFLILRRGGVPAPPMPSTPTLLATLDHGWQASFLDGMGAPAALSTDRLASWTDSADPAVRFYSGRVRYVREVQASADWPARSPVLDLGRVGEVARVRVNGVDLGVRWMPPFRFDLAGALRPGRNRFEVEVANYWVNRIVGDRQPGATARTFAPIRPYDAATPLRPSGLMGPVRIVGQ